MLHAAGTALAEELIIRFVVGGLIVAGFSVLSDLLRPKSFAGLFGAAPSVALATLVLTVGTNGKAYAAYEARSMIAGAIAFFVYAYCAMQVMFRWRPAAMLASALLLLVWLAVGLGLWAIWLK